MANVIVNLVRKLIIGSTTVESGTDGRVIFEDGGVVQQDADLHWDNTNKRLGVGTASPSEKLDVDGDVRIDGGTVENTSSTTTTLTIKSSASSADRTLIQQSPTRFAFLPDNGVQQFVINEGGGDVDFRVEGDNDANLIFTDAANDRVGIGTTSPTQKLDVDGNIKLSETAATTDTDKFVVLDGGVLKYRTGTQLLSDIGAGSGTVTSVEGTGTVSGLTLTGTVTTSGNLTLGGTISISSTNITDVDPFSQSGTYASLRAQATTKGDVGLGNVENTALSTYTGNGGALDNQYITNGAGYTTNTGTVDTSGVPVTNDFAIFTDANTIEGRSYSEVKSDLSLDNVENIALSTYTGNGGALDNQYITNGAGYTTNTGTVTSVEGTGTVSGLTLTGTVTTSGNLTLGGTISISSTNITDVDPFSQSGTYASLRAQATTKGDVGLGNVENTALSTYTGNGGALDNQYITNGAGYTTNTGTVTGTGTTNYISKWTSTTAQGNSQIFDNGTNIGIGTTSPSEILDVNGTVKAQGYKSSDGSAGITQDVDIRNIRGLTIKNGIITAVTT